MVVSGFHAVEAALRRGGLQGTLLLSKKNSKVEKLKTQALAAGIMIEISNDRDLNQLCRNTNHQGVVLKLDRAPSRQGMTLRDVLEGLKNSSAIILMLDGINDPHNFGAILRSADQFAVDLVVVPDRRSVRETQTVYKTSAGASAFVSILSVPNLVQALEQCKKKGFWIYGADVNGDRLDTVRLKGRIVLVMGGESRGLRRLVAEHCDGALRIPAAGQIDSFNVSVAAGILLYEIRRQQGFL